MDEISNITIKEAADFFRGHDDFLILSHTNPDGDTMGCSHGLCGALQRMGKRARIGCADPLSPRLSHLREAITEQDFEEKTIVSVDIADKRLMGELEEKYGDKVMLAVDHHVSHVPFAEKRLVEPFAAAACETVYEIVKELGVKMDKALASCFYTGLATDTGCFRYPNVTPRTHRIAAELYEFDFDYGTLNYVLFDMKTRARVALEQKILADLEFFCGGKCAMIVLPKALLASVDSEDANGISALPRQIEGVEVGVVIKEKDDCWRVSMRSQNLVDVQKIASRMGGGGHMRAAGCSLHGTVEEVKKQLVEAIGGELDK